MFTMAKGRRYSSHQHRIKTNTKHVSKSRKKHSSKHGEVHPTDVRDDVGKVVKKARREAGSGTEHKSDDSDGEINADPYMELVGSFNQHPGSHISHLAKKWREFIESDSDEDSESRDDKDADGNHGKQSQKNIKEQKTQHCKEDRKQNSIESGVGDVLEETGDCKEDHQRDQRIDVDEAETDQAYDYRKEDAVANESDNDDGEDGDDGDDANKTRTSMGTKDPFMDHFQWELEENVEEQLRDRDRWQQKRCEIPSLGSVTEVMPPLEISQESNKITEKTTFKELRVKARLGKAWQAINSTTGRTGLFTPLQQDLFNHMNSYKDLFYSNRTFQNGSEIRRLYCFHAVNHIFKTRFRVMKNNAKIVQSWKDKKDIGDQRDQGLTRPKVLILVPFRDAALKVVEAMMQLVCPAGEGQVMNKKRLYEEFSEKEEVQSSRDSRPQDFKQMFEGNIDDCFRLGIAIVKKSLKLYSEFYSADVIVASPLGLRTIIGSLGEKTHEYDFLSSIEVLILDQTDVFLMQNWEHVKHVFDHLHLQPKDAHGVDFSRVRMWCLNGWSKYYRQTIMFSSFTSPEINSLFNRNCHNYGGKVKASLAHIPGSICQVAAQVPQAFHRIECSSFTEAADKRFNTFINKILPEFKGSLTGSTAIFVPSYFDFVRLRNYFKREAMECAQISEYSQRSDMQRARTYFQLGKRPFLLFTERFYFFYRYRIKRIKNIIFYELPHYSTFYPEILNFMDTQRSQSDERNAPVSCTVLYTKFNVHRLAGVVGTHRCRQMVSSDKHVHMFVTGDV